MSDFEDPSVTQPSFEQEFNDAHSEALKKQYPPQVFNPTENMSDWEKFAAGAGKSAVDIGRSINMLTGVSRLWGQAPPTEKDISEIRKLEEPLMSTKSGIAGNVAGILATTALPLGMAAKGAEAANAGRTALALNALVNPQSYGAAAAGGALIGGAMIPPAEEDAAKLRVLGQPIDIPSRAVNAIKGAAGGLLGNAAANVVGRVAQPVSSVLSDAGQKAVSILDAAGVPLDAAQRTGSAFLGRMKASLFDNPFTAGKQLDFAAAQKTAYNKAILKTIGEDADAATPQVMGAAKKRIGQVFEDVGNRNPIHFDDHLQASLASVENDARGTLNDQQFSVVQRQFENILNKVKQDGKIDGNAAMKIKTQLDKLSGGQDQAVGQSARDIREAMDEALQRSTAFNGNTSDYQALHEARTQWGNMRKIESTIDREGKGDISPARLASVLHQKASRSASVYGEGSTDLSDLAHAGNLLLPEKLPQSGTIPRALASTLGLPGVLGGAEYLRTGDPKDAAMAAAAGFAGPRVAQAAINNPTVSKYLAQGMTGGMVPIRNMLLSPNENALVGQAKRIPISLMLQNAQNQ